MPAALNFIGTRRLAALAVLAALAIACDDRIDPPTAVIVVEGEPATVGQPLVLDGESSSDPQDRGLIWRWRLVRAPIGSVAVIELPEAPTAQITPDVLGSYVIELVVDNGALPSEAARAVIDVACAPPAVAVSASASAEGGPVGIAVELKAETAAAAVPDGCPDTAEVSLAWRFVEMPAGSRAAFDDPAIARPQFTPDVPGDYTVEVVATDALGRLDRARVAFTAACGDAPPVISDLSADPAAGFVDEPIQISATVTDPDADTACGLDQPIQRRWRFLSRPAASRAEIVDPRGEGIWFTPDAPGTYVVALDAFDPQGHSATDQLTIEVSDCGARPPEIGFVLAEPDGGPVGVPLVFRADVSDPDADPECGRFEALTYAWTLRAQPAGSRSALTPLDGQRPFLVPDVPGDYAVTVVVTDETGRSDRFERVVEVTECGSRAPTIDVIEAAPAAGPVGAPISLQAAVTDLDTEPGCAVERSLQWRWRLIDQPAGSAATVEPPTGQRPTFIPDVPGAYVAELTVTDAAEHTARATVRVDITACGAGVPAVALSADPAAPRTGASVRLAAAVSDPDTIAPCDFDETFALEWTFVEVPPGFAPPPSVDRVALDFVPTVPGTYRVRAAATDAAGHVGAGEIALDVDPCGAGAPSIVSLDAAPNPAVVDQPVALSGIADDPDLAEGCGAEERLSWAWRFAALPAGSEASLLGPRTARPSFVPDVPGDYALEAVVTDARGLQAAERVVVAVGACGSAAPSAVIETAPAAPSIGDIIRFSAAVDDADVLCGRTEHFQYAWTVVEAPAGFSLDDARLVGAAPWLIATQPGTYTLRVDVTDATGRVGSAVASVVVANCGAAAPVVESVVADPVQLALGQPATLTATVSDADAEPGCDRPQGYRLRWQLVDRPLGSAAALTDLERDAPTLTADVAGDYTVRVVAVDETGMASAPFDQVIEARDCGARPPLISLFRITPPDPIVGTDVQLRVDARDPDADGDCRLGGPVDVVWRLYVAPAGSAAVLTGADGLRPWFHADLPGRYAGDVTITDLDGDTLVRTFSVDVGACGSNRPVITDTVAPADPVPVAAPVTLGYTAIDADTEVPCLLPQQLTARWRVIGRPGGSVAEVDLPAADAPSFTPDMPGRYRIELVVSDQDGRQSDPAVVEVVTEGACGVQPPVALVSRLEPPPASAPTDALGGTSYACAGQPFVLLDAGVSIEPDNVGECGDDQSLFYRWRVRETPPGGTMDIREEDRRVASFVVDMGGRYVVEMDVTDDTGRTSGLATAAFDVVEIDPPVVERIDPTFFCGDGDESIDVFGSNFIEYDGILPTVLVGGSPFAAAAVAGCVEIGADPLVRACDRVTFVLPAEFDSGIYDVRVQNPFPVGCTSGEAASLVVAGSPRIDSVEPEPICRGQFEGDLVLTGDGFFVSNGNPPIVRVNGAQAAEPELAGCRDLTNGLFVCTEMRFSVPGNEQDQSILDIEVANPPPADCEVGRFRLIQSEPPVIDDVQPRKICDLGGFLDLTGDHFEAGMTVDLGGDRADEVLINLPDETFARAIWDRGNEPRLDVGLFDLTATNASGCAETFSEQIRVTEGPFVFFVDPPVVFNGTTLQATVYLGNLYGGTVTRAVLTAPDGSDVDVDFTFDPLTPNRIQIIVPEGLDAGAYDVTLYDDVDCPGTTEDLVTVTDTLTVELTGITPRFGWAEGTTAITMGATAGAGFVPTPRAYLNPSPGDTCAADAECGVDQGCYRGNCVEVCAEVVDCLGGEACLDGRCVPTATELRGVVALSEIELQGIVDAGRQPGDYDLVIVNPDGTVGLAEAAFTVTAEPPPVIDSVTPGSWETNNGALPITVAGSNFRASTLTAECRAADGTISNPPLTVQQVQGATIQATVNTGAVQQLSVCVLVATNDDGSTAEFSPITTTNPAGNFVQFRAGLSLNVARQHLPAVGGRPSRTSRFLYALGGEDAAGDIRADGEFSALDRFGEPGPWMPLPMDLPAPRARTKAVRIDDFIYLPGGVDGGGQPVDSLLRALVLDPLNTPSIDNLDFEFTLEAEGLPTGVYIYRVSAVIADDDASNPGGETLASDPQPVFIPDIPQGVIAQLDWPDFPGAQSYRVYRSVASGQTLGNERLIAEVPADASNFDDDGSLVPAGAQPLPVGALGAWHEATRLARARRDAGVTVARLPGLDSTYGLYIGGGLDAGGQALGTVEGVVIDVTGPRRQGVVPLGESPQQLGSPRGRLELLTADSSNASVLAPDTSVVYALGGDGADRFAEFTYVRGDGAIEVFRRTTNTQRARAGYASAVANNNIVQVGGQGGGPSSTADKVNLCGGACGAADPAELDRWSALGQTDLVGVVDMGRIVFDGFLYVLGGRFDNGVQPTVQISILGGTP